MTLLTLVRHGQTDWNLARRIQGSTDIPLNLTGEAQALTVAGLLAGDTFHAVYASPLLRARRTAEIIGSELGLPAPDLVAGVREREFGEGEGLLVSEYLERYGDWQREVRGAETLSDVRERAIAALDDIARASRRRSAPLAESLLVVTHGGVIRALLTHSSRGTIPAEGEHLLNASVHRFVLERGVLRLLESETSAAAH